MKMMDINGEDDCSIESITPAKKKKMKQAQLPFHMRSPVQSPNVMQSKKRKLTSPSMENKSPKVVKIARKRLSKDNVNSKPSDADISAKNKDDDIEIIGNTETENVKENTTSNKVKSTNINETPKRTLAGQKKLDQHEKLKSSSLTKFLQKTDKQEGSLSTEPQKSSQKEQDEPIQESSETPQKDTSVSELTNDKIQESHVTTNNSLCQSDSDIALVSSDNEDEDEQTKLTPNTVKGMTDASENSKTPKTDKAKQKKLTPKQQEKKLLSAKKKEERQRLKMEKEKKLEEERQNRRKEKEEKRKEKEERERVEKEQKLMEKKIKEQKKQMEIEQKQKEKQAKEEERKKREEAKEEEKRKKEEEKLEAERKKQKAASNFTSFFVAKKQEKSIEDESMTEVKNFMPFEVKADMKIAPVCRRVLNEEEKLLLVKMCNEGNIELSDLYLTEIKDKKIVPRKSSKTWPLEAKDDVILLDEENDGSSNIVNQDIVMEKQRPKLLQFSENQRPPYWGTWRKSSDSVNPRRPFSKDTKWFNYEVDSDEEWEEEEPGESLHGSDDEKDEENPDDNEYDVDNDFMVPHGYLSDEELRADEEDNEDVSPETQKFKLKVLGDLFETERNTKTSKLKPKMIGCVWRDSDNKFPSNIPQKAVDFLSIREAWVRQIPVTLPTISENEFMVASECTTPTQPASTSSKKSRVPEVAMPDLIRLVHGNMHGRGFLVKEFMSYWSKKDTMGENPISKSSLLKKIREIGKWMPCPEEGPMHSRACWYVFEEYREKYVNEGLPLPNRWTYNLIPMKKTDFSQIAEKLEKEEKDKEKKNVPLITQFTKKITQEEMKKQLTVKPARTTPQSKPTKPPKRATLISVGRGEQFSKTSKENLLKSFVNNEEMKNTDSSDDEVEILESFQNDEDNEKGEGLKSGDKKENEDRLDAASKECEVTITDNEKISKNVTEDKSDTTLKSGTSTENSVPNENVKETVDTPMDVDDNN